MCLCVLLLLLVAMPALAGPRAAAGVSVVPSGPAFSERQQVAVLARVGDSAELQCRVLRLADRVVSWVRSRDLQILTHAGYVFTADSRVSCSQAPSKVEAEAEADSSSVHTLRIERLREADSGRYECQVNTEPKLSLFFNLTVVAEALLPTVTVRAISERAEGGEGSAGGVVWGTPGGAARLVCEARYEPTPTPDLLAALPPLRIHWLHEGEPLDPQSARGGVSLDTERWASRAVSRLTLAALQPRDAGRYECVAGTRPLRRASLRLRLRHGGRYDALEGAIEPMQRDEAEARVSAAAPLSSLSPLPPWPFWWLLLALCLT